MSQVLEIVQFGMGGVGRALFGLIVQHKAAIRSKLGVELRYRALVDSTSVLRLEQDAALSHQHLLHLWNGLKPAVRERLSRQPGATTKPSDSAVLAHELERLKSEDSGANLVVVDVSGAAAEEMIPVITAALSQGHRAVLANKRPLCGSLHDYKQMVEAAGFGLSRLRYETTVGAALPVISTLRNLANSFDLIEEISGTFSGTLGYLTTRLEEGSLYSEAVAEAKLAGYTEPDPRDDLGGVDVARKALILARTLGYQLELSDVKVTSLYPAYMQEMSLPEFMTRLTDLDKIYLSRSQEAAATGETLRYVATVKEGHCRVGLEQVLKDSQIGRLKGTDN
ncbi:MAG: homoserine dehydrogenase, partial [Chloroflexota bacterium]